MAKLRLEKKEFKQALTLRDFSLLFRIFFAVLFFALGIILSKSLLFNEAPFFSLNIFIELLIAIPSSLFGYYVFPRLLVHTRLWLENLIKSTVTNIVTDFWEQQSRKIQQARRDKKRQKAQESVDKLEKELSEGILIDTSVLVDGRLLDIVKTGFFDRPLIILRSVLNELQLIADNKDKIKRQRGRRGLDVVKELKKSTKILVINETFKDKEVDKNLVDYAKGRKLKLMTLDFNLNKLASVSGIVVLNLNDLINALKTVYLPGEELSLKILQEGKEKNQGIGYLNDGTMVVVEEAKDKVGQEVSVKVLKIIQSSAGKIVFSQLIS